MRELRNFYGPPKRIDDKTHSIEVAAGANITDTIAEAISVARGLDTTMQFEFNGVTVSVCSDSDPKLIQRDLLRALRGYIDYGVGPNPVLTDKEKESDTCIEVGSVTNFGAGTTSTPRSGARVRRPTNPAAYLIMHSYPSGK